MIIISGMQDSYAEKSGMQDSYDYKIRYASQLWWQDQVCKIFMLIRSGMQDICANKIRYGT